MTLDIITYREWIGPLQLSIHVVQNRHVGTQKSHWGKTNNIIWNSNFLCSSCTSVTFASQHGGFVPREWKAAKGLLRRHSLHPGCTLATTEKMIEKSWKAEKETEMKFKDYILISNRPLEQSCYLILVFKICFKSTVIFSKVTQLLRNEIW